MAKPGSWIQSGSAMPDKSAGGIAMTGTALSALITVGLLTLVAVWVPCQIGFEKGCARLRGQQKAQPRGPQLLGTKVVNRGATRQEDAA